MNALFSILGDDEVSDHVSTWKHMFYFLLCLHMDVFWQIKSVMCH